MRRKQKFIFVLSVKPNTVLKVLEQYEYLNACALQISTQLNSFMTKVAII